MTRHTGQPQMRWGDLRRLLASDLRRHKPGAPTTPVRLGWAVIANPGMTASLLLRIEQFAVARGQHHAANLVRTLCLNLTGADFVPGCSVGEGLLIAHPNGIVFGEGAVVGDGCTVLQQVTLGERFADGRPPHDYPRVGSRVVLGAGAKVLGRVMIGDDAAIGANSVVLSDVSAGSVAVGVPARVREPSPSPPE